LSLLMFIYVPEKTS